MEEEEEGEKQKRQRGQIEMAEKERREKEKGERGVGVDKQRNHDGKLQSAKILAELVLGDAARDRCDAQWKSSFTKSAICDSRNLKGIISEYEDADEWRLLKGLEKED